MAKEDNKKKKEEIQKADETLPDVLPPELARKMAPELRQEVTAFFWRSGPTPHPFAKIVTAEHLDKVLEYAERDSNRRFRYVCGNRWFALAVFVIILAAVGLLLCGFHDKPGIFTPILTSLLGFGAGFGIGKRL